MKFATHHSDPREVREESFFHPQGTRTLHVRFPQRRLHAVIALLCFFFLLLLGRSAYLQIIRGDSFRLMAETNRFGMEYATPKRGQIFDAHGLVLADNRAAFVVTMRSA